MRELTIGEFEAVDGGGVIAGVALVATAAWLWSNRGALNDIANSAFETMSALEAECEDK